MRKPLELQLPEATEQVRLFHISISQEAIDYLRANGRLMAVGLPAKATLDASIFFTVFKSITIHGSYVGNRQDAVEAISIAASGNVKCHYATKKLADIAS